MNEHDDLDQLVSELNLAVTRELRPAAASVEPGVLASWLAAVREANGSDLLLVAGSPPVVRAGGKLTRLSADPLDSDDVELAVAPFLTRRLDER